MSKESPSVVPQISKNTSALSSTFKGNVSGKVKKHWYFVTIWWIIISLYWNRLEWNLWESWGYAHWPVPGASTVLGMLCEFNSCLMRGGGKNEKEWWKERGRANVDHTISDQLGTCSRSAQAAPVHADGFPVPLRLRGLFGHGSAFPPNMGSSEAPES